MDAPENMEALYTVGQKVGLSKVDGSHFPSRFNLE
jgi:hypothetical protein